MNYVLSLSYGKDSMACLGALEVLGWPLDRIVTADEWATDTIPADLPPMEDFKARADAEIKKRYGITVEHFCAKKDGKKVTYESAFYRRLSCGKREGEILGWPYLKGPWCNSELKMAALKVAQRSAKNAIWYVGIAVDEDKRFHVLNDKKRSPLIAVGWTEADCRRWCAENGLLSPTYDNFTRGGCWFCHNQGLNQLRQLRHDYPDLWQLMLKWDKDSPVRFKERHSLSEYDKRFCLEDEGLIQADEFFRWEMLNAELNYRLF